MHSADVYLKRAAVALSVILVLLLGAVATYSLLRPADESGSDGGIDVADAPGRAYPGPRMRFGDREAPLVVGCLPSISDDDLYVVAITNEAEATLDYVVAARLVPSAGSPVEARAEIVGLQPGEEREVVLVPEQPVDDVAGCDITAIESDRRVLLANR